MMAYHITTTSVNDMNAYMKSCVNIDAVVLRLAPKLSLDARHCVPWAAAPTLHPGLEETSLAEHTAETACCRCQSAQLRAGFAVRISDTLMNRFAVLQINPYTMGLVVS
jgi:hypothetical protein